MSENMITWFSLQEVCDKTGIPYASVARYVKNHASHLQVKKEGTAIFVHPDSVAVLEKIRLLYQKGLGKNQVEKELSYSGIPLHIDVPGDNEVTTLQTVLQSVQSELLSLRENHEKAFYLLYEKAENLEAVNHQVKEELHKSREEQKQMIEKLEKNEEFVRKRLDEHDKLLMQSLRESQARRQHEQEIEKLIASALEQQQKKKKWWKFWE